MSGFLNRRKEPSPKQQERNKDEQIRQLQAANAALRERLEASRQKQIMLLSQMIDLTDAIEAEGYEVLWHKPPL